MSNQFIPIERDKPVVIPMQEWLTAEHLRIRSGLEPTDSSILLEAEA